MLKLVVYQFKRANCRNEFLHPHLRHQTLVQGSKTHCVMVGGGSLGPNTNTLIYQIMLGLLCCYSYQ